MVLKEPMKEGFDDYCCLTRVRKYFYFLPSSKEDLSAIHTRGSNDLKDRIRFSSFWKAEMSVSMYLMDMR